MSATNRGAQRRSKDDYPTPPAHTRALTAWLRDRGLFSNVKAVLDPCSGSGAILRVVRAELPSVRLIANELDLTRFEGLYDDTFEPDVATAGDALDGAPIAPDAAVISNFPFTLNDAFIDAYVSLARPFTAALLPMGYFGSDDRCSRWIANPPAHVLVMNRRPQFVAVCKGITASGTRKRIKGCGRMYDLGTRGTCTCGGTIADGSDAMTYAWAVWIGATPHGETRFSWLRVPK